MPLSPLEIKIKLLRKGSREEGTDTLAGLARKWKAEHPHLHINEQVLSRVINRRAFYVYPEVCQLLADYLGVRVAQIGRQPQPRKPKPVEEPAEAAV